MLLEEGRSGKSIERFAKERGLVPQRIRWLKSNANTRSALILGRSEPVRRYSAGDDERMPRRDQHALARVTKASALGSRRNWWNGTRARPLRALTEAEAQWPIVLGVGWCAAM